MTDLLTALVGGDQLILVMRIEVDEALNSCFRVIVAIVVDDNDFPVETRLGFLGA